MFVKVSLVWLIAALATAAFMTFGDSALLPVLLPTHLHLFVVGWVTHMIVGVALWLFPKHSRESPRGSDVLSWIALAGLSLGLILRAAAEPALIFWPAEAWNVALVISAILQWIGGMAFVANIWPRVKGK